MDKLKRAVDEGLLLERTLTVRADELEAKDDRTIPVVFSSETSVRQWFGREVLEHKKDSIDFSRMDGKIAPVLLDHSRYTQIGVVERGELKDKQGHGVLRFSKNTQADEIYQDILDGIRSQVSVGYKVLEYKTDDSNPNDPLYTITRWQPFEVSIVAVGADPQATVKRGYFNPDDETREEGDSPIMADKPQAKVIPADVSADVFRKGMETGEQSLALEIIEKAGTLEDFDKAVAEKRKLREGADDLPVETGQDDFRLSDLIFQTAFPGSERGKRALEEAKDLTADAGTQRMSNGFVIPHSRLGNGKRDITTASGSGGNLISDDVRGDLFVETLRNRMVLGDMVTVMSGLQGNVSIPNETTAPTAQWRTENQAATESNPVIGQLEMTPHFVRSYVEVSRTLIAQSDADVEMIVRNILMKTIAVAVDAAILTGSNASGQPSGVDQISGLSNTQYATGITNATVANLFTVEKALDNGNAPDMGRAWIAAPNVREHFRGKPLSTGGIPAWHMDRLLDTPAYVTKNVADGEAYYGAWDEAVLGLWNSIEVLVNEYSLDTQGLVRITAWQMADVVFKHGASFAKLSQS